ncbi:hypothetical protein RRG08_046909 [Elysia crispata]|uniref:Uncharacterized protein n=1 Tax=Elysia crispata TaxID=231223 RepID=A0AAE0ZI24_9GAST|nr:hypothetical protein RRG08_046909 [Elysia crispata]
MGIRSCPNFDVLDLIVTYFVTGTTWILVSSMDISPKLGHNFDTMSCHERERRRFDPRRGGNCEVFSSP